MIDYRKSFPKSIFVFTHIFYLFLLTIYYIAIKM